MRSDFTAAKVAATAAPTAKTTCISSNNYSNSMNNCSGSNKRSNIVIINSLTSITHQVCLFLLLPLAISGRSHIHLPCLFIDAVPRKRREEPPCVL